MDVERIPAGSRLELYISPACPYCKAAMAHYDSVGTQYVAHDAQNDRAARRRMFAVPAIIVDGKYVQSGWGRPPQG